MRSATVSGAHGRLDMNIAVAAGGGVLDGDNGVVTVHEYGDPTMGAGQARTVGFDDVLVTTP